MLDFDAYPGLLYVYATLLPLASFVLLLLVGALRAAVRPFREQPSCASLYQVLGGDQPGKTAAYVATLAIGLACVLTVIGFVRHAGDLDREHHLTAELAAQKKAMEKSQPHDHSKESEKHEHPTNKQIEQIEHDLEHLETRWQDRMKWIQLGRQREDSTPPLALELGYRIDSLAALMFVMVTFIATLIHIYSIGYMGDELQQTVGDHQVHTEHGHLHRRGRYGRFFMFLSLFCFSMLNLVLADNLFQVFISWELVGICSYLLIGFYYERQTAADAGNKAFITNRVGDAGFIIGLLIIWTYMGTFNFQDIFKQVRSPEKNAHLESLELRHQIVRAEPNDSKQFPLKVTEPGKGASMVLFPVKPIMDESKGHFEGLETGDPVAAKEYPKYTEYGSMPYWLLVVAGLGIFLGCVGKSAQFPLQVWLPDAMEGPTPVSALIHAATMVAAGVYLVGRCYPLFTPESRLVIAYTGGITLFVAATIALVMTDIKKVLAYSTVSQLGYMMLALGVGGWAVGLFHLLTHAFFKALLFLGSGAVIYGCHHEQEMTKMGGLLRKMPITAWTMLVGVLAIAGTPMFSGWYSKDGILAHSFGYAKVHPEHALLFVLPLVTAGITTFYMFRMWFMTFTGAPRDEHVHGHAFESPWVMTVPLVLLAIGSLCVGWGWPIYDAEASIVEKHLHHSQHSSIYADFGHKGIEDEPWIKGLNISEQHFAYKYHATVGLAALLMAGLGFVFAALIYKLRVLDPAEAKAQFPGVYSFLWNKWYFDDIYRVLVVRPALTVAGWCRVFDTKGIDGVADGTAKLTVQVSKWDGQFDLGIVDGLVNLTARVIFGAGAWLRNVQTGYIRSYILFLVLAAISLYVILAALIAAG